MSVKFNVNIELPLEEVARIQQGGEIIFAANSAPSKAILEVIKNLPCRIVTTAEASVSPMTTSATDTASEIAFTPAASESDSDTASISTHTTTPRADEATTILADTVHREIEKLTNEVKEEIGNYMRYFQSSGSPSSEQQESPSAMQQTIPDVEPQTSSATSTAVPPVAIRPVTIYVILPTSPRSLQTRRVPFKALLDMSVGDFKRMIHFSNPTWLPYLQQLVVSGIPMRSDSQNLAWYGVSDRSTIYLSRNPEL